MLLPNDNDLDNNKAEITNPLQQFYAWYRPVNNEITTKIFREDLKKAIAFIMKPNKN